MLCTVSGGCGLPGERNWLLLESCDRPFLITHSNCRCWKSQEIGFCSSVNLLQQIQLCKPLSFWRRNIGKDPVWDRLCFGRTFRLIAYVCVWDVAQNHWSRCEFFHMLSELWFRHLLRWGEGCIRFFREKQILSAETSVQQEIPEKTLELVSPVTLSYGNFNLLRWILKESNMCSWWAETRGVCDFGTGDGVSIHPQEEEKVILMRFML